MSETWPQRILKASGASKTKDDKEPPYNSNEEGQWLNQDGLTFTPEPSEEAKKRIRGTQFPPSQS
jgi:hypothetical protein